jgi:hypothetical protein
MERAELDQINRVVGHEVKKHFPPGAVQRAMLLQHGDAGPNGLTGADRKLSGLVDQLTTSPARLRG